MNLNVANNHTQVTKKQLFARTPIRKDGLVLQLHHTVSITHKTQKVRFVLVSFSKLGQLLAACDHKGTVFVVDFLNNKFWTLSTFNTCTVLKFSDYNDSELIIGTSSGKLTILNVHSGEISEELIGHSYSVADIHFSHDYLCLTSGKSEAIVWNLKTNSKVQVLSLEEECVLKSVLFMPVTSNILACFNDDTIHVWKYGSFESYKQIQSNWSKHSLKSITFTRDGRAMVISGHSPCLAVFLLDTWSLAKTIVLPDYIFGVKKIDFISQPFDGGSNRILTILASNGIVYFYDMQQEVIVYNITENCEVIKFDCSSNGKFIALILSSGEINVYNISSFIKQSPEEGLKERRDGKASGTVKKRTTADILAINSQLKRVLDIDKLRSILKEFGQYPESFRIQIWSKILQLPHDTSQYNAVINHKTQPAFENLEKDYPLFNKLALKNMKKLLSNIVTWSPFFAQINYLPVFVFPFVKVFQNEPVLCFETVCSVILNWCQHWFEYFPLPPINTLAMIEHLLMEHDYDLLCHFTVYNITSQTYAWPLLETAFSEILTAAEWCMLWDHILSNEPSFLLMCTTAYSILQRNMLFGTYTVEEFETFYRNQNPINVKKLISKSYSLFNSTNEKLHPRQYLEDFKRLEHGGYAKFDNYPKLMDHQTKHIDALRREEQVLKEDEQLLKKQQMVEWDKLKRQQRQDEEKNRLKEMENVCRKKVNEERKIVTEQRKRLADLRKQLLEEEIEVMNISKEAVAERSTKDKQTAVEKLLTDIEHDRTTQELEIIEIEDEMISHYSELLKHKAKIEGLLDSDAPKSRTNKEHLLLQKQQKLLAEELEEIRQGTRSKEHLRQLNVATGIATIDSLINKVESELAEKDVHSKSSTKLLQLEAETKELEIEVGRLLDMLAESRLKENSISPNNNSKKQSPVKAKKVDSSSSGNFEKTSGKLSQLRNDARDGYEARPNTPNKR